MNLVIIAPHPDDETLGAGGTLLKYREGGANIFWIVVTSAKSEYGYPAEQVKREAETVEEVAAQYRFKQTLQLGLPPAALDAVPEKALIGELGSALKTLQAEVLLLPFGSDAHSDHRHVFSGAAACLKWFRYPSIKTVLTYETLSETEFNLNPTLVPFRPNCFSDISRYLAQKIEIMKIYDREISTHPFPRSIEAIRALATLRGANSGFEAAEAFMVLKTLF